MQIDRLINGIPVSEYHPESSEPKGVIFMIHGHTCSKEPRFLGNFPNEINRAGFLLVAIDAYRHGLRIAEPYMTGTDLDKAMAMPEVILKTCEDLAFLYEQEYHKIGGKLGFIGISMGGHVVFQMPKYLPNIEYLMPIIGAPDLKRHYYDSKAAVLGNHRLCELEDWWDVLSVSPLAYSKNMKVLIIEGEFDTIVDHRNAKTFFEKLERLGYESVNYCLFPVAHETTVEMEKLVHDFITGRT
jgi:uncharacterized protein